MTTKALLRTTRHDQFDAARDTLRARMATTLVFGEHSVQVIAEPLLRHGASGQLEQSIRITADVPLTTAEVRDGAGSLIVRGVEPATSGLRVFIDEFETETDVVLSLPELGSDTEHVVQVGAVRHWDIHLVHHSHLDIGYTDPQGRVLAEHLSYLDSAMRLVAETDDLDPDAQFRWAVESLWSFEQWAANRPPELVEEFLEQVRAGRVELTAMPFNLHSETCSTDELHELLRLANELRENHGVSITAAMQTDVPGHVGGLVDALASNGVRYLSVAHNWAGRSVPHLTGGQDVPRLFWWASPGGEKVMVWVTDSAHGLAYMEGPTIGFDVSYEIVEDSLPSYLTALATRPYPFDDGTFDIYFGPEPLHRQPYELDILHLRVQGHFGDNAPPRRIMSETVKRWNETWAFPHLRLSTNADFFDAAEERYGDRVPTFTGDWNDWWADGVGAGARPMQMVRQAQSTVADTQTIAALASALGAQDAEHDHTALRDIYLNISLFDEHTWGAANSWKHGDDHRDSGEDQWHWKYNKAIDAHDDSKTLKGRVKARLGRQLGRAEDALASVYAVNPTASERSGVLRIFLPDSRVPVGVHVAARDTRSSKELAIAEWPQVNPTHREAGRYVDIAIDDVPPLGMVRIDLVSTTEPVAAPVVSKTGDPVLENEHLRVEVDLSTASIRSIVAKQLDVDLVNQDSTFGFNAYIYDTFGSAGGLNHMSGGLHADEKLSLMGERSLARAAALVEIGRDTVRSWLTYETTGPGVATIRTTLSLEHGSDRLDIENRVDKDATMAKECAYFAFPMRHGSNDVVRYDITGSVGGSDIAQVPGGAQHMRAMRTWIAAHDSAVGVALTVQDAALVQIGDTALPYAPFPTTTPKTEPTTVYSWIHNNLWDTNFPVAQAFEMTFRYSVAATAAATPEAATVFAAQKAEEKTRTLSGVLAERSSAAVQAVEEFSLLAVSDERVRLVGVTTPYDGALLVRLQSVAEETLDVNLTINSAVVGARAANLIGVAGEELPIADGEVTLQVPALGTAACLLELGNASA